MSMDESRAILKRVFGYDAFRLEQEAVIRAVLAGRDCLVLMPTGGGKSLCYQIPAIQSSGVTVVVSPLIALMKDQVDALRGYGIAAAFLNSTQSAQEQAEIGRQLRSGELKLLYVAPERLIQEGERFIQFLKTLQVSLFAIDEAHCISSWGHDFRPEYMKLDALKAHFSETPVIALTATADKLVRKDILERLKLHQPEVFVSSFNRENIYYAIEPKRNTYAKLVDFLHKRRGESGIIYCLSRASVESLAARLCDEGFTALPYHAGLERETRQSTQEQFLRDDVKIIVATIAFGMGIDKSNVRFVVHYDLPKNIESYYQETGRAGRDGLESHALLFFSWGDIMKLRKFAEVENNPQQSKVMLKKLQQMGDYAELTTCRRKFLLSYFSEDFTGECGNCDNCGVVYEVFDGTILAQKAMSAVVRTGEQFGMAYLVDLLRGSHSSKLREEHKALKTFGVGADVSKDDWFAYFKGLIRQGFLAQSGDDFPIIQLTEKSRPVLKGKAQVQLRKLISREEKTASLVSEAALPYEEALFERLKTYRRELSEAEGVPAYQVFSDTTLIEMATYLPLDAAAMHRISGVGDVKFERYGRGFLAEIVEYCRAHSLTTRIDLKRVTPRSKPSTSRKSSGGKASATAHESLQLFRSGLNAHAIAQQRQLAASTIENHLAQFIASGEIALEELVIPAKIEPIQQAIAQVGADQGLKPLKEYLGESFSYAEIRAVLESNTHTHTP